MSDLTQRLRERAAFDDKAGAAEATDNAELFEQYFTNVEPGPMGTPKQIFRMGFAQGYRRENARLKPLLEKLIDCVEALEYYANPESKTFCSGDYEAKADEALAALKSEEGE